MNPHRTCQENMDALKKVLTQRTLLALSRRNVEFVLAHQADSKQQLADYLRQCRAEGRRMAVVTSSVPEHCRTALTHLDLMKYFEGVTLAHDLGLEKKDPALWRAAAEHYGVAPEDCTVFDDSLSACKGARAAKMRVVGVYDGFFAQDEAAMRGFCDVYIRSFEELLLPPRQALRP